MITNVGKLLQKEREKQGLTLDAIEKETKIRKKNLEAIEDEKWLEFPSRTYIQGIIKTYGSFLGLDEEKLIAYFRREYERREQVKFKQRTTGDQFRPQTRKYVQLFIGFIGLIFLAYFGYQLHQYLSPPDVLVTEPKETSFKREDKITLKGQTEKDTIVTVNDERAFLDDENMFSADVPLVEKENKVVIKATGANGKVTIIEKVFYKEEY